LRGKKASARLFDDGNFPVTGLLSSAGYYRENFMRSVLLWAIGIPLPIIIILWLVTGHA
jgi:hypothetical protein